MERFDVRNGGSCETSEYVLYSLYCILVMQTPY